MVNNINTLIFWLIIFFIACTYANLETEENKKKEKESETKSTQCAHVMQRAELITNKEKFVLNPKFLRIIIEVLEPLRTYIGDKDALLRTYGVDKKVSNNNLLTELKGDSYKDLKSLCIKLNKRDNNNFSDQGLNNSIKDISSNPNLLTELRGLNKSIKDILPTCKVLSKMYNFKSKETENTVIVSSFESICVFLFTYENVNSQTFAESKYTYEDLTLLFDFIQSHEYSENDEENAQQLKNFCHTYSNTLK